MEGGAEVQGAWPHQQEMMKPTGSLEDFEYYKEYDLLP